MFPFTPALWSHALAGLVFLAFAVRILIGWRGGPRAAILFAAVAASFCWAAVTWVVLVYPDSGYWNLAGIADAARLAAWLVFLTYLVEGGIPRGTAQWTANGLLGFVVLPGALVLSALVAPQSPPWLAQPGDALPFYALLGAAVFGLSLVEQLYRRSPANRRWAIKPLVIGLAGLFAFELVVFSIAVLFHRIEPEMWAARGLVGAVVMGFVAIATARNTAWTVDVYLSRNAVYQSTALLITGAYLLLVASAAYWVHFFGGDWGGTLRVALVFCALVALAAILLSGSLRARLKVLIAKNVFSYRYDYREEWLRFTRMLGTTEHGENLYHQVVRALSDLVESNGGAIWLEREGRYHEAAALNLPSVAEAEPAEGALAGFLARTDWVVDLDEARRHPERYAGFAAPAWLAAMKDAWLVVPLPNGTELTGYVVLAHPRAPVDVNWEVRDLLKTASRQAASYLAQLRAKEALVETAKFDAFNRMSAFVVHDLKNLVAQLGLMVKNAERHRDNPEFQKDMLVTVEHVVSRMNQLMLQLRTGTTPMEKPRPVELGDIIGQIIQTKGSHRHMIHAQVTPGVRVLAHADRLERVIGHMVQNALEAVDPSTGRVDVRVDLADGAGIVEIQDNGSGMSEQFVRERLFHPFQTTKPQGMGIGMYESSQYLRGIGARLDVESVPGEGTRFRISLPPAADASGGAA